MKVELEDSTPREHEALFAALSEVLVGPTLDFGQRYDISGLSSAALALQVFVRLLQEIGGPASERYMHLAIEGAFAKTVRDGEQATARARFPMLKMAEHFALLVTKTEGPRQ